MSDTQDSAQNHTQKDIKSEPKPSLSHNILVLFAPYQSRGGEEIAFEKTTKLLSNQHQVRTCLFSSDEIISKSKFGKLALLPSFYKNSASLSKLKNEIQTHRPDVVICHNIIPAGSYALYEHLYHEGIPVIQYIHNYRPFSVSGYAWLKDRIAIKGFHLNFIPEVFAKTWQNSSILTLWYALALKYSHIRGVWSNIDHWVAVSDFVNTQFVSAGIPSNKITTAYHSVDMNSKLAPVQRSHSVMYIGRLSVEKGGLILLEAWATIKDTSAQLHIAGDGPLKETVLKHAKNDSRIIFHGQLDAQQRDDLLSRQKALIVPSLWWEAFGLVCIEAYKMKTPVIASHSGALPELVSHQETGWLYSSEHTNGGASELATCIEDALCSKDIETMGNKGLQKIQNLCSEDAWLNTINDVIDHAIKGREYLATI